MINPHKISKAIRRTLKWLIITNYGRFVLGAILAVMGIFSQHSTIEFLSTDYAIFDYSVALGCGIIIGQFLWVVIRGLYLLAISKQE